MSNHYHVVLFVDKNTALNLTDHEVVKRWSKLCAYDQITKQYLQGGKLEDFQKEVMKKRVIEWRERLQSISWFMKFINERVARCANKEDGFKGAFWESRFKSQALLNERALLACMAYVDLNPIRSEKGVTNIPQSHHTSIRKRVIDKEPLEEPVTFIGSNNKTVQNCPIGIRLCDYIELVEWTGKYIQKTDCGSIPEGVSATLEKNGLNSLSWSKMVRNFEREFKVFLGPLTSFSHYLSEFARENNGNYGCG